jgi:polar amino acid transport system substrate-binding protein
VLGRRAGEEKIAIVKTLAIIGCVLIAGCVTADVAAPEVVRGLAPTGKLRAAINFGNPVLAQKEPFGGVSVDLSRELARRLDVPVELVTYDAAGKVTADAGSDKWDIAFVARDPDRAKDIEFTAAYVIIEGGYMVPSDSSLK